MNSSAVQRLILLELPHLRVLKWTKKRISKWLVLWVPSGWTLLCLQAQSPVLTASRKRALHVSLVYSLLCPEFVSIVTSGGNASIIIVRVD